MLFILLKIKKVAWFVSIQVMPEKLVEPIMLADFCLVLFHLFSWDICGLFKDNMSPRN